MTPCINMAKKAQISYKTHEYVPDSLAASYGGEAAKKMGVDKKMVFKTLVVSLSGSSSSSSNKDLAIGIIPVSFQLNMKLMAKASGSKKANMAETHDVERSTGYVLGGVSPLGQKNRLLTIIDASAQNHSTIFVSAGRRGLEIELKPKDLEHLTQGMFAELCTTI